MTRSSILVFVIMLSSVGMARAQDPTDKAGWVKLIEATLDAEKDQDALSVIGRAAKAFPEDMNFKNPGKWFERHGERRIKDKGYDAGFAVVDRALKVLPAGDQTGIKTWRVSLYRFWSQELLDKKDFDGSLKVLARGYADHPTEMHIQAAVSYHTQEALKGAKSPDAALEVLQSMSKQFPKVEDLYRRGLRHAALAITKLVDERKYKEAFEAIDTLKALLPKEEQRVEMAGLIYDGWALDLASKKQYEAALDKFKEGLKAHPSQTRLQRNALAIIEQWAEPSIKAMKWDDAIRIYDMGLKYFPGNEYLQARKERCAKLKEEKK